MVCPVELKMEKPLVKKACDTFQDALGPDDKPVEGSDINNASFS
jgi:hypothetical protein